MWGRESSVPGTLHPMSPDQHPSAHLTKHPSTYGPIPQSSFSIPAQGARVYRDMASLRKRHDPGLLPSGGCHSNVTLHAAPTETQHSAPVAHRVCVPTPTAPLPRPRARAKRCHVETGKHTAEPKEQRPHHRSALRHVPQGRARRSPPRLSGTACLERLVARPVPFMPHRAAAC